MTQQEAVVGYQQPTELRFIEDVTSRVAKIEQAFIERVASISEIRQVYSLLIHGILRFWIVIDAEVKGAEYQVYAVQGEMYREFDEPKLDFLVLNRRDFDDESLQEIIPSKSKLIFPAL